MPSSWEGQGEPKRAAFVISGGLVKVSLSSGFEATGTLTGQHGKRPDVIGQQSTCPISSAHSRNALFGGPVKARARYQRKRTVRVPAMHGAKPPVHDDVVGPRSEPYVARLKAGRAVTVRRQAVRRQHEID